jgi:hypothetical protein
MVRFGGKRTGLEDRQLSGPLPLLSPVVQAEHRLVHHPGQQEDLLDLLLLGYRPSSFCSATAILAFSSRFF